MNTAEVYWILGPWRGHLGIVPRPRGGDWLADEIRSWRAAGLNVVASLLTPGEVAELDLQEEAELARAAGVEFHALPIPDLGVPRSRSDFFSQRVGTSLERWERHRRPLPPGYWEILSRGGFLARLRRRGSERGLPSHCSGPWQAGTGDSGTGGVGVPDGVRQRQRGMS